MYGSEDEYLGPMDQSLDRSLPTEEEEDDDDFGPAETSADGADDGASISEMQKRTLQQRRMEMRSSSSAKEQNKPDEMTEEEQNLKDLFAEFDVDRDELEREEEAAEEASAGTSGGIWSWISGVSDRARSLWTRVTDRYETIFERRILHAHFFLSSEEHHKVTK